MELKELAAFIGGVTGPISLVWAIYRYFKERPHLKVEGEVIVQRRPDSVRNKESRRSWLVVRITNFGKSPIVLTGVFPVCGEGKNTLKDTLGMPKKNVGVFSFMGKNMPVTLKEAEFHQESLELNEGLEHYLKFDVHTSTGLTYSNSIKNRREIKIRIGQELAEIRKLQARDSLPLI
jgi:hypothetical protein